MASAAANNNYSNTVFEYDITNDSWTQKTSGATVRGYQKAIVYQDKMYIFGGQDNNYNALNDVWEYDLPHEVNTISSDLILNKSGKSGFSVTEALNSIVVGGIFTKNTDFNGEEVPDNLYSPNNSGSLLITADAVPLDLLNNTDESLICENSNLLIDFHGLGAGKKVQIKGFNSNISFKSAVPSAGGTSQLLKLDLSSGSINSDLDISNMDIDTSLLSCYLYDNGYDNSSYTDTLYMTGSVVAGSIELGDKNWAITRPKLHGACIAGHEHELLSTFGGSVVGERALLINNHDICMASNGNLQSYGQHQIGKVLLKGYTDGSEIVRPFVMPPDSLVTVKATIVGREENTNAKYVATYESIVDNIGTVSTETGKALTISIQDDTNMTVDTTFANKYKNVDIFPIMLFHFNGNSDKKSFWTVSLEYTWVVSKVHSLNRGASQSSTSSTTTEAPNSHYSVEGGTFTF